MLKKFLNNYFLIFLLVFPFFNPNSLKFIPATTFIYDIIQIFKLIDILLIMCFYVIRGKITNFTWILIGYAFINIFTSLLNGVINSRLITDTLLIFGLPLLFELSIEVNFTKFVKTLFFVTAILSLINLFLSIIYPNGLGSISSLWTNKNNPMYFLGIDNGMIKSMMPLLFCCFYLLARNRNSFKRNVLCFTMIAVSGLNVLITKSTTGIMCYAFTTLLFLFFYFWRKRINPTAFTAIYIVFFLLIIIYQYNFIIADKIFALFGKTATFTGRASLWNRALELIWARPIIGYGAIGDCIDIWGGIFSSHNMFLELGIHGGFLLIFYFVFVIIYSTFKNRRLCTSSSYNIAYIILFSYLVIGLMEVGVPFFLFCVVSILIKIKQVDYFEFALCRRQTCLNY